VFMSSSMERFAHPLTVARQARNWSQQVLAHKLRQQARKHSVNIATSKNTVYKWERGQCPDRITRRLLAELFGIPWSLVEDCAWPMWLPTGGLPGTSQPQTQDGAVDATSEVSEKAPVDRRNFAALTGTALTTPVLAWMYNPEPFQAALDGRQVSLDVVEAIEDRTDYLRHLDDKAGGGELLGMVAGDLRACAHLLRNSHYSEGMGKRLFSVAAELCRTAGWLYFDNGRHAAAQACYFAALRLAHVTADRAHGAIILAYLTLQATWLGNTRDALELSQAAQNSSQHIALGKDAALAAMSAGYAHAHAGDGMASSRAFTQADRLLERDDDGQLARTYWMDEGELTRGMGQCLLMRGQAQQAKDHLERGISLLDPTYTRDRAEYLTLLATAHAQQQEPEQACQIGSTVLGLLNGQVNSPRTNDHIHALNHELEPYDVPYVREFTEQARQLL